MKKILIFLLLLSITPWYITIQLNPKIVSEMFDIQFSIVNISNNISFYASSEFLFFSGDGRPGYGTGDHGVFLLSFMPLILVGTYHELTNQNTGKKLALCWMIVGFMAVALFSRIAGLPGALWYLPAISIIATRGFNQLYRHKIFFTLNTVWIVYEGIRLYHVILTHKPFSL